MSEFCLFVPNDPSCYVEPEVVEEVIEVVEINRMDFQLTRAELIFSEIGNLTYLFVAFRGFMRGFIEILYHNEPKYGTCTSAASCTVDADSGYYDDGEVLERNWWKYAGNLFKYSNFLIMTTLLTT